MKFFKKSLSVVLALLMALTCFGAVAFAADAGMTVSLRVEGIAKNLFNGDVTVSQNASAYDVLKASGLKLDASESSYGVYVSGIENEYAGTFGGWDGWLFTVNDVEPSVGMDSYKMSAGDKMVVYYGDPYGIGMQYPKADLSKINEGIISFTSLDTVYDENWNPIQKEAAVTGYTLYWDSAAITPDENGVAKIPADKLTAGNHSVQIEKKAENGCPLVLRLAPDFTVTVKSSDNSGNNASEALSTFAKIVKAVKDFFVKVINAIKSLFGK